MINYHGKWNATMEHFKTTIPHLIYLKEFKKNKTIRNKNNATYSIQTKYNKQKL